MVLESTTGCVNVEVMLWGNWKGDAVGIFIERYIVEGRSEKTWFAPDHLGNLTVRCTICTFNASHVYSIPTTQNTRLLQTNHWFVYKHCLGSTVTVG